MDYKKLNWLYVKSDKSMEDIARIFGYSRRQLTNIITGQRESCPEEWPKRNGYPPGRKMKMLQRH